MNFVTRYVTACFRPSKYRQLIEDKKHTIWSYLLVLILVLTMIENVIPFLAWDASIGGLKTLFLERLPGFTIENGVMECDQPMTFSLGDFCTVREDTGVDQYSVSDLGEERYAFYFSRTNVVVMNGGVAREIPYKDFGEGKIDNSTLVSLLPVFRISLVFTMFLSYGSTLVRYMLMAGFYTILCLGMVKDPGGDRLPAKVTYSIAVYAKTLFGLISSVGSALGYPMNSALIELVMVTATVMYIFRGQASVLKLDLKK